MTEPTDRTERHPERGAVVRAPTESELEAMQRIGVAAGERFATVGMPEIAADPPFTIDELETWRNAGRAWVRIIDDQPVGFVVVDLLDGAAHIEEISVLPDRQGEGHGVALLNHVASWARGQALGSVTLTTFTDVPWNRPYYERRGFRVLGPDEITPELADRRHEEAENGLDPDQRVCMRLDL